MLKKIFVCLTLGFLMACPGKDLECEECLESCDFAKREGDIPSDIDCLDYCVFFEECGPVLVENRYKEQDAGNECWMNCPCEFEEDPLPQCTMCKEDMGC